MRGGLRGAGRAPRRQHRIDRRRLDACVGTQHGLQHLHGRATLQRHGLGAQLGGEHAALLVRRRAVRQRLGPRHMAFHQVGCHLLQHIVLVGDQVHGTPEHLEQLRAALLHVRDDLVAHVGAEPIGMRVGGVLAPQAALGIACARQALALAPLHVVAQVLAPEVEQRADDGAVGVLHGAEAARPGAHHGAHVEVLHAVIGGVGGEDAAL